jgi:leader peptidase (prepilin peptidase)/N-methyltransferase
MACARLYSAGGRMVTGLFFAVAVFLFGLIIGSFLNVCIYRLPRGESLVYPPSHCPKCYQPIRAEDNIPVISWFLLRGRCRFCKQSISPLYPAIEFLTGALFLLYYWRLIGFENQPSAREIGLYVVHISFFSALVAATVIDFRFLIIPDEISLPGIFVGLAASFILPEMHEDVFLVNRPHLNSLVSSLVGAAAGGGVIYCIGAAGKLILRKEAMGFGDVKLMAMIGAVLGWKLTIFVLFLSALMGTAYGLVRMATTGESKIPYGPFLSIAAIASLVMREHVDVFIDNIVQSYRFILG